jgi:hypothetical protein
LKTQNNAEDKSVIEIDQDTPIVAVSEDKPIIGVDENAPFITAEEDIPIIREDEDLPISREDEDIPIISEDENKVIYAVDKQTPIIREDEDKVIIREDDDKVIIREDENKLIILKDKEKLIIGVDEDKVIIVTDEEKPIIGANEQKPIIITDEEKPLIGANEEKPIIVTDEEKQNKPSPVNKSKIMLTRRSTINQNFDQKITYVPVDEVIKEESYNISRKSITENFASDKKVTKLEDNTNDKWVEDIEEKDSLNEVSLDSHNLSTPEAEESGREDYKPEEKAATKEASTKTNLDHIEEKDQDYIDFNIRKEEAKRKISEVKVSNTYKEKEKKGILKRRTSITISNNDSSPKKVSEAKKKPDEVKVLKIIDKPVEPRSSFKDFKKKNELVPTLKTSSNNTAPTALKPKPHHSEDSVKVLFKNYSPERSRKSENEDKPKTFSLQRKLTIVEQVIYINPETSL